MYPYYYCTHRKQNSHCTQKKYLSVEDMEGQIERELMKLTILPEFKDWALEILNEQNDGEIEKRTKVYESQQTAMNDAQRQLDNLTKMRYRELIDDAAFIKERDELKTSIAKIKKSLHETEDRAEKWLELTEKTFEFACYAHNAFLRRDPQTQQRDLQLQREILIGLGQNFSMKDQKLTIVPNDWLVPIIEKYPAIEKQYQLVRTKKYPSPARQKAAFAALRPLVRERRDLNPQPPP